MNEFRHNQQKKGESLENHNHTALHLPRTLRTSYTKVLSALPDQVMLSSQPELAHSHGIPKTHVPCKPAANVYPSALHTHTSKPELSVLHTLTHST